MMISLQENPTLAIRLGPLAESRLYKIAHPAIFCDLSFVCLIQIGLWITPSPNWISALLFFLRAQNSWGRMEELFNCLADCTLLAFGAVMLTSKEYVRQAEDCLQLANASSDVYVREALTELASDFKSIAKALEQRERNA
jgi:hypothetical protein